MAFGGFFKKKDDDFSDFDTGRGSDHLGLPSDGDITNTSPGSSGESGEASAEVESSPGAFDRLHSLSDAADKYTHPTSQHSTSHKDDRIDSIEKDIQIINAKVDSIKSLMESINQRLIHIEKLAEDSTPKEEVIRW